MTLSQYTIYAYWHPREEGPDSLAFRFKALLDRLAAVDPVFGNWMWLDDKGNSDVETDFDSVPFEEVEADLPSAVAARVVRDDWDEPTPEDGYSMCVFQPESTPRSLTVSVSGGSALGGYNANYGTIETNCNIAPDPAIVTYAIMRSALVALAESFDVEWCAAYPADLVELRSAERYGLAWISYVCPRWASLVVPPRTAIVEHRPNGGLLLAATDETFITANSDHLAVARDINAALAPVNALPETTVPYTGPFLRD